MARALNPPRAIMDRERNCTAGGGQESVVWTECSRFWSAACPRVGVGVVVGIVVGVVVLHRKQNIIKSRVSIASITQQSTPLHVIHHTSHRDTSLSQNSPKMISNTISKYSVIKSWLRFVETKFSTKVILEEGHITVLYRM